MAKFKCVGGSMHGKRIAAQRDSVLVPVWNGPTYATRCDEIPASVGFTKEVYEIGRVQFGPNTSIRVMRLVGMSDDEFHRRIADIVEL